MFLEEMMTSKKTFTGKQARQIGESLGIDWRKYNVEQFRMGLDVELEHGKIDPHTNVTNDDPVMTGKIALAHLNEFPDYYTRLDKMEKEAEGKL
jgi:DNA-directed RNA polymerase alpha subunit